MKSILILTNIPSPYRVYLFNKLNGLLKKRRVNLTIMFYNKMEKNRDWKVDTEDFKFNFIFANTIKINVHGKTIYLNIDLIKHLKRIKPDLIILGGSWLYLDYLYFYFNRNIRRKLLIWSEINIDIKSNRIVSKIRDYFYKKISTFIIPGVKNYEYFKSKNIGKKFILLPNIINENYFLNNIKKNKKIANILIVSQVNKNKQVFKTVKRIIDLKKRNTLNIKLDIIGRGDDTEKLVKLIYSEKDYINYHRFIPYNKIFKYYSKSDIFILSSKKDPSPLSAVEAIATKNILLVSRKIGNLNEVLIEGENGYYFNPDNYDKFEQGFLKLLKWDEKKLINARYISSNLYDKYFKVEKVLNRFVDDLLGGN